MCSLIVFFTSLTLSWKDIVSPAISFPLRESKYNYKWTYMYLIDCLKEYQYRNEIKTNFKIAQKLIHGKMCNMYILKENISI